MILIMEEQNVREFSGKMSGWKPDLRLLMSGWKPDLRFSRRSRGFTILELVIVLVIMAILLAMGTLYWQKQMRDNQFRTQFNQLVEQIREAQVLARSYGVSPTGYNNSGATFDNTTTRDYTSFVAVNGINITWKSNVYKNVRVSFNNFTIRPMTDDNLHNSFKGVALALGYLDTGSPGKYFYDKMLPFDANGTPFCPQGETGVMTGEYEIEMSVIDSSGSVQKSGKIFIDSTTGAVRSVDVK
jgi:prepilin-type N-terminal cleavage/methylation domain-containing protein